MVLYVCEHTAGARVPVSDTSILTWCVSVCTCIAGARVPVSDPPP